jgi:hypothetical protein
MVFRKTLERWQVTDFLIAMGIALLPILIFNQLLYGHPFASGYRVPSVETSVQDTTAQFSAQPITYNLQPITYFFPFGFHPRTALIHLNRYFVMLAAWMTLATLIGFVCLIYGWWKRRVDRSEIILGALFLGVTGWLALVYGSWVVHDNPDPTAVTVGISYSRYWLPIFVLGSGVAGVGLARLAERLQKSTRWGLAALLYAMFIVLSFNTVFLTPGDGLRDVADTLDGYSLVKEEVLSRTEPSAVIVADRGDKLFFPDRQVITPFRDESTYAALQALQWNHTPLYYYGITLTADDLRYHNEEKLPLYQLRMFPFATYGDHTLYHFVAVTETP